MAAISPALHYLLAPLVLGAAVPGLYGGWMLESVMPPATMSLVLARLYRLDERLVASATVLLTPVSVAEAVVLAAAAVH